MAPSLAGAYPPKVRPPSGTSCPVRGGRNTRARRICDSRTPRRIAERKHMTRTRRSILSLAAIGLILQGAPAHATEPRIPEWVRPAVRYLSEQGWLNKDRFRPNEPMSRAAFSNLMTKVFGGGYGRTDGDVRAAEVSAALVKILGKAPVARELEAVASPDGWQPRLGPWFGTEIVAREMGL